MKEEIILMLSVEEAAACAAALKLSCIHMPKGSQESKEVAQTYDKVLRQTIAQLIPETES